jgi:thiamine-phosphate pyrophosphorylase
MDERLVGWARAVKARRHARHPVLWLLTDLSRQPDPLPAILRLPKGLCGVVFRHDGAPRRRELARAVAALCRRRRLALTIAGDWRLAVALGAGQHCRARHGLPSRRGAGRRRWQIDTASAHGAPDVRRALRAGCLVFLSPVYPTPSHPGARTLGPCRWGRMAAVGTAAARAPVLALGGINAASVRRLPQARLAGAGAIAALSPVLGGTGSSG